MTRATRWIAMSLFSFFVLIPAVLYAQNAGTEDQTKKMPVYEFWHQLAKEKKLSPQLTDVVVTTLTKSAFKVWDTQ